MRKYKKLNVISYYDKCWKYEFFFCLGWPIDVFEKYMLDKHNARAANGVGGLGMCFRFDERYSIIWTRDKNNSSTLAHECIHAATHCLEMSGMPPTDSNNDEALAYVVTCAMREAMQEKGR